jgi:hypothetical protein
MAVTGLFLARREEGNILRVGLDYVVPEYRDFKNGRYIYLRLRKRFIQDGFDIVKASGNSKKYVEYLKKLGFTEDQEGIFFKVLDKTK